MKTGTKSLLFGVHHVIWHPVTVLLAWISLYGFPTWRELICIIVHDWGYWGLANMDDREGEQHPVRGALLALKWFGGDLKYYSLVALHSRHYARLVGCEPSRLCWADKRSIMYDPPWFYLLRACLSGEIREYRAEAAKANVVPLTATNREWFAKIRDRFVRLAEQRRGDAIEYCRPAKEARS